MIFVCLFLHMGGGGHFVRLSHYIGHYTFINKVTTMIVHQEIPSSPLCFQQCPAVCCHMSDMWSRYVVACVALCGHKAGIMWSNVRLVYTSSVNSGDITD